MGQGMVLPWKVSNALGYNVLWGHAPDKLYHSYMIYKKCKQRIGVLVKNQPIYIRVDAFNESGITEGTVFVVRENQ